MKYKMQIAIIAIAIMFTSFIFSPTVIEAKQDTSGTMEKVLVGYSGTNENAINAVTSHGGSVTATFHFVDVIGALVPTSEIHAIEKSTGISYVTEQMVAHIDSVDGSGSATIESQLDTSQEMPYGIEMVNAPQVWDMGYTGEGVRIAVLDTGLDFDHPDAPTHVNKDLSYDFVNGDPDATDDNGHGTHVAGTIAAPDNGIGVIGVAPGAEIVPLKVCDAYGDCPEEALMLAMEWSMMIGADIISMSLGGPGFNNPGNGQATTAWKHLHTMAYQMGILIVAAAGNTGTFEVDHYPSSFSEVIAVGAVDSSKQLAGFSTFGAHQELVAPGANILSTVPRGFGTETSLTELSPTSTSFQANAMTYSGYGDLTGELFYGGLGGVLGWGDTSDFTSDAVGKIALISRGSISFAQKAFNAYWAGASGVIVYNNAPGNFYGTLQWEDVCPLLGLPFSCPWFEVVSISQEDGMALLAEVGEDNSGSVTVNLKIEHSNYAYFDGTSMATPHVAGVAALVMSANPDLSNKDVRMVLDQTAENLGSPGQRDIFYGWGLVNALAAVMAALP